LPAGAAAGAAGAAGAGVAAAWQADKINAATIKIARMLTERFIFLLLLLVNGCFQFPVWVDTAIAFELQ
jgi:hypothetical protein